MTWFGATRVIRLWRCRWPALRLGIALFALWTLAADGASRASRLALAALPGFDYVEEVESLRREGRYAEALTIAEAGLEADSGLGVAEQQRLIAARDGAQRERESWVRRVKDVGLGALTGRGDTLEALGGAVVADFFVAGDVRDLVIQGGTWARGDDPDEVIAALSAAGLVTTLAPEIDWVPSLLKAGKKAGAMTKGLSEFFVKSARARKWDDARAVLDHAGSIAKRTSPAGTLRVMKHADTPEDVARMSRMLIDAPRGGAVALHVAPAETLSLLRSAEGAEGAAAAARIAAKAAKKGEAGRGWLKSGAGRTLLRPHPLVGALKGVWKGTLPDALQRALERLDDHAWWLVGAAGAWAAMEAWIIGGRLRSPGRGVAPAARAQA